MFVFGKDVGPPPPHDDVNRLMQVVKSIQEKIFSKPPSEEELDALGTDSSVLVTPSYYVSEDIEECSKGHMHRSIALVEVFAAVSPNSLDFKDDISVAFNDLKARVLETPGNVERIKDSKVEVTLEYNNAGNACRYINIEQTFETDASIKEEEESSKYQALVLYKHNIFAGLPDLN